jgi:hypothetical protein
MNGNTASTATVTTMLLHRVCAPANLFSALLENEPPTGYALPIPVAMFASP